MNNHLVIFDLDGTLFRTDLIVVPAVRQAAADLDLALPGAVSVCALIGENADVFCRRLFPGLDDETRARFQQRLKFHENQFIPKAGRLFDGVVDVLKELRSAGATLAICSNGSKEYIMMILSVCGVSGLFEHVRGRDVRATKPELIRYLIGQVKPTAAVIVGDRVADIEAARSNNLPSIGVTYGFAPDEARRADLIAEKPSDIIEKVFLGKIFQRIERDISVLKADRPVVVGINGIDVSGKTIFAESLSAFLTRRGRKVQPVHLDDFHNPKNVRSRGKSEIDAYINNAFDLKRLTAEVLEPARQNRVVNTELTLLDLETDTCNIRKRFSIEPDSIVLVEGVLLYRPSLNEYFDYRIFVDISFDEMIRRATIRDVPRFGPKFIERYKRKYIPIQQWYLETFSPEKMSNVRIDNNDFRRPRLVEPEVSRSTGE